MTEDWRAVLPAAERYGERPNSGLYILGHNSVELGRLVGRVALPGHPGWRHRPRRPAFLGARRRCSARASNLREVYMYTVYERLWHWLQTGCHPGPALHRAGHPQAGHVRHVQLPLRGAGAQHPGAILVINAALALFYHLASGEIKQFLPAAARLLRPGVRPGQILPAAASSTAKRIPSRKRRQRKLNPLQQVTYFGYPERAAAAADHHRHPDVGRAALAGRRRQCWAGCPSWPPSTR